MKKTQLVETQTKKMKIPVKETSRNTRDRSQKGTNKWMMLDHATRANERNIIL